MSNKFLKVLLLVIIIYNSVSAQQHILQTLDTISTNEAKLEFLQKQVDKNWYTNPKVIGQYAKLTDSIAKVINTPYAKATAKNIWGMYKYVNQNYDSAIQDYLKAVKLLEAIHYDVRLSMVYNNLAACYKIRKDYKNTEKYYLKALKYAKKANHERSVAMIHNNLALIYQEMKMYEKADQYSNLALKYYKSKKDSVSISINYLNNGNSKILNRQYDKAIYNYQNAMSYIKENTFPLIHAVSHTGIGIALTKQQKYKQALPHLTKGIEIAKRIKHFEQLMESYKALADYDASVGNYKNAYQLALNSQKLKDSFFTVQQDKNLADALMKFESEKKDQKLKILHFEKEKSEIKKRWYFYLSFLGLFTAIVVAWFLYKNNKNRKLLKIKNTQLTKALDDYQMLLKETHHRVKNSLQLISSLLYLQSESIKDKKAAKSVKEGQMRVKSVALIHQKLYKKDCLTGIEVSDYINDLVLSIFQSHQIDADRIELEMDLDKMTLDIDTIIPIGIIINELVVNTIKHAFDDKVKQPKLFISFKKKANQLILKVMDNGKGFDLKKISQNTFGIKLIKSLIRKLKATFEVSNINGTTNTITINEFVLK